MDAYRPPDAELPEPARSGPSGDPGDRLLTTFLGESSPHYLEQWRALRSGRSRLAGFNIAAACLTVPWLCYRRLYWLVIPVVAAEFAVSFALFVTSLFGPVPLLVQLVVLTLWVVVPGLLGNLLVYRRAKHCCRRFRTSPEELAASGELNERVFWLAIPVKAFATLVLPWTLLFQLL